MLKLFRKLISKLFERFSDFDEINYISSGASLPPPLSKQDEIELSRLAGIGDESAKRKLIEHNLRLVVYIAKKFDNTGIMIEDLISIGTIGLIKAVNTFKADKNIKLATYASRCIENEILMHLRKSGKQKFEISLDEPLNVDWDGNELLLGDVLGSDGSEVERKLEDEVDRELLYCALSKLTPREKRIVELRFGLNGMNEYTQKQVADMLGISQSYISRLEKRILDALYDEIMAMQ